MLTTFAYIDYAEPTNRTDSSNGEEFSGKTEQIGKSSHFILCVRACVRAYVYTYVNIYVRIHASIHTHIRTYIPSNIHTYACVHTCMGDTIIIIIKHGCVHTCK